jgi:hypothetical protein
LQAASNLRSHLSEDIDGLRKPEHVSATQHSVEGLPLNPEPDFCPLITFLQKVPSIKGRIGVGRGSGDIAWWAKFTIDTFDPLAWRAVQELGHVLNYLSLDERLPTVFKPVSPPPYLNGGVEFLSWVIECHDHATTPSIVAEWLQGRLPRPMDDRQNWELD